MTIQLSNPAFRMALEDIDSWKNPNWWAQLSVTEHPTEIVICIHYGVIHSDGSWETPIGTRYYYNVRDGIVTTFTITHV